MKGGASIIVFSLLATNVAAQSALVGEWRGYWIRAGDSMEVTLHVNRDSVSRALSATFDSKRLRVQGIPFAEVRMERCCEVTMLLRGDRTTTTFTGILRNDRLSGELREGESDGRFTYVRMRAARAVSREREVSFSNGAVTLAGSLILPSAGRRHPAVVFIHGSGAEGRWASRFLATTFAENGVAALIFDKRGVGKSLGDWRTATLDDLAGDAAAAVAYLRRQEDIDPRRVGLHGHSQGGTLLPMIAARADSVAFLIASAAAGIPTDSTEMFSILNSVYPSASTQEDSANARDYVGELVTVAYRGRTRDRLDSLVSRFQGRPWFVAPPPPASSYWYFSRLFGAFRPLDWWMQVRIPTLLVYGAADMRVPAGESATRISEALLRHARNADVTVRIFPGADHSFRLPPGPSGWPVTAPDYVPSLVHWLRTRTL